MFREISVWYRYPGENDGALLLLPLLVPPGLIPVLVPNDSFVPPGGVPCTRVILTARSHRSDRSCVKILIGPSVSRLPEI